MVNKDDHHRRRSIGGGGGRRDGFSKLPTVKEEESEIDAFIHKWEDEDRCCPKLPWPSYTTMHMWASIFQLINGGVQIAFAILRPRPLEMGYLAYERDSTLIWNGQGDTTTATFSALGWYSAGVVDVKLMCAIFSFIACFSEFVQTYLHYFRPDYTKQLEESKCNVIRWIEHSITCPMMSLIITRLAGQNTITGWLTLAGCNEGMILCHYLGERYKEKKYFAIGCLFLSIILAHDLLLIIVAFLSAPLLPWYVYSIIGGTYVFYLSFALVAGYVLLFEKGRLMNYWYVEMAYTILSFSSKTALSYQAIFALP